MSRDWDDLTPEQQQGAARQLLDNVAFQYLIGTLKEYAVERALHLEEPAKREEARHIYLAVNTIVDRAKEFADLTQQENSRE